jgi:DNA polymerase-3 subunit gamma/tau
MGQALYRKYRSKSLGEVVGQDHITDTLATALKAGKTSHAYLFTGPRGVGKTSIARILAHELNGLSYDETGGHIDIIEIDAASNNGVEDVRDLREKVYVAPAQAKYKVYIIDEVHMLSKAAFNALLKTLEEPPEHVVFILATTEAHKLPETIISRTQRFVFRPIEPEAAVKHLRSIAQSEKITISDEALELIVQHGGGSFRDSISLLDQVSGKGGGVGLADVQALLGIAPQEAITGLVEGIVTRIPANELYKRLAALLQQGYQPAGVAQQLSAALRADIVEGRIAGGQFSGLLTALLEVPVSHDPEAQLEITLLGAGSASADTPVAPSKSPVPQSAEAKEAVAAPEVPAESTERKEAAAEPTSEPAPVDLPEPAAETVRQAEETAVGGTGPAVLDAGNWQQVLNVLKKQHNTLYGIIRMAQPDFDTPGKLTLAFNFAFHQKRANDAKNRKVINDAIISVAGGPLEIICIHDSSAVPPKVVATAAKAGVAAPAGTQPDDSLASISNIFGGGELLQSD